MNGWRPGGDVPRPSYPDEVIYEGGRYEVLDVDVLGRWLLVQDDCDHYVEVYADVADLEVPPIHDARPVYWCDDITSFNYKFQRAMRSTLAAYREAIVEQISRPLWLLEK